MSIRIHLFGRVTYDGVAPVDNVGLYLVREKDDAEIQPTPTPRTNPAGLFDFYADCEVGRHVLRCKAFGRVAEHHLDITDRSSSEEVSFDLPLSFRIIIYNSSSQDGTLIATAHATAGHCIVLRAETAVDTQIEAYHWKEHHDAHMTELGKEAQFVFASPGHPIVEVTIVEKENSPDGKARARASIEFAVSQSDVQRIGGRIQVSLDRTQSDPTLDQALWVAIRNRTHAISFERYRTFIEGVLELGERNNLPEAVARRLAEPGTDLHGVRTYQLLKFMTEAFLLIECGVRIDHHHPHHPAFDPGEESKRLGERYSREEMERKLREYLGYSQQQLPYITRVVEAAFPYLEREAQVGDRLLTARINEPLLIELVHTYFLEEGMLMQTMNAVCQRFQNSRVGEDRDPLANLEIDPLRPLNNLIWGYIQDEPNRLTVRRRAFEYLHEYGLTLYGRATYGIQPADSRSAFLEAFHNLLYQSAVFFKEDFQTTVIADGFPLLNALKEVHLILAQGAHNQFGDLPWTARVDTLLIQFILARPEMRGFLQSRAMVPYKEAWMPQVDAMKTLQGWTDVTVTQFRDLAVYGEQLLLSIRYGDWIGINDEDSAKNWARYWRPEIQGYVHAYRAATGVELTGPETVDTTIPAIHLQRRLAAQRARAEAPKRLGLKPPSERLEYSQSPGRARRFD